MIENIGKYKIIKEIGSGGMGIVYLAHDPIIDRKVAIKFVLEKTMSLPQAKERFYREARAAGQITHENITVVHDVGEEDGKPYIVMEYLRGTELRALITDKKPLTLPAKIDFAIQICKGLQKAHSHGVIHRDIKPENIMVLQDGKIKIMDFGIARAAASTLTMTGSSIGTPFYMSPEQVRGKEIGKQSDIFSFGVVLYELLSYKRPFTAPDITVIMYKIVHEEPNEIVLEDSQISRDFQKLLSKCLAKDVQERYQDFSEVIRHLETIKRQHGLDHFYEKDGDLVNTVPIASKKPSTTVEALKKFLIPTFGVVAILAFTFRDEITQRVTNFLPSESMTSERRSLDEAKIQFERAKGNATQGTMPAMSRHDAEVAVSLEEAANRAMQANNYAQAESLLLAARDKYVDVQRKADNLAGLKGSATEARANAVTALNDAIAQGAKGTAPYEQGINILSEGDDYQTAGSYGEAQSAFMSANAHFASARKKATDIKVANQKSQLARRAADLQLQMAQARSDAEAIRARAFAEEAVLYASLKANNGNEFFTSKRYSDAISAFENATNGYERAIYEMEITQRAQSFFENGDYQMCLTELRPVFSNYPYQGENRKASELRRRAEVGLSSREQKIQDATEAANGGDLRTAMVLLNSLAKRDQNISDVQILRHKIVQLDKMPPVVGHAKDKNYNPNEPLRISATAQDNLAVAEVTLHYQRKGAKSFSSAQMASVKKGVYTFEIPKAYHKGKEIRYYIAARDDNGNEQSLGSAKKVFKIKSRDTGTVVPQIP